MSLWLSSLELVGGLRRTVELGPARGELRCISSGGWWPSRGSTGVHEDRCGELGREFGWTCSSCCKHRLSQLSTLRGESELEERRSDDGVAEKPRERS